MKPLVVFAAIACAVAACTSGLGGGASLPSPTGTEPTSTGAEPGNTGREPTGGGIEPGVSGNDPPPTAGGGETIAQLCAQFCNRAAGACGGTGDAAQCAANCTEEITASGSCQSLYLDALHCLITEPLTCDGTNIMSPNCTNALLAVNYCINSTPPPTTGGGTATGAP